jgi:transcriptional regulator with XRE-family HTH domain
LGEACVACIECYWWGGSADRKETVREEESVPQIDKQAGQTKCPGAVTSRATDTDRHVGARIRERRVMLGLSQQQMADMIGVTYQQAHKYERGINRISAGRLYQIAQVLRVPIEYFFEELDNSNDKGALGDRQRMCLELARNFSQIPNQRHQDALSQLARALATK